MESSYIVYCLIITSFFHAVIHSNSKFCPQNRFINFLHLRPIIVVTYLLNTLFASLSKWRVMKGKYYHAKQNVNTSREITVKEVEVKDPLYFYFCFTLKRIRRHQARGYFLCRNKPSDFPFSTRNS